MSILSTKFALADIVQGFRQIDMAAYLAWDDIRERYVRTFLGPLWIVLSTGIWFGVMGFVMGNIFGQHVSDYLPYLVCGLVSWLLISTCISEGSQVLIQAKRIITSYNLPIFLHFLRFILRNKIIFLHNAVILVVVLIIFPQPLTANTWLLIPGLLLNILILTSGAVLLALANIRYRDTHMVITNALQVLPYVTPIFWKRDMLKNHTWVADFNPIYHMIEVIRAPLLGTAPTTLSWMFTVGLGLTMPALALIAFLRFRHRIIFWL
jgi:ABC-type polysaccharide/polyol phosphate export permease